MAIIVIIVVVLAAALLALAVWVRREMRLISDRLDLLRDGYFGSLARSIDSLIKRVTLLEASKPRLDDESRGRLAKLEAACCCFDKLEHRLADLEQWRAAGSRAKAINERIDILARHFQEHTLLNNEQTRLCNANFVEVQQRLTALESRIKPAAVSVDALRESFNALEACVNGRLNMLENQLGEVIDGTPSCLNARLAALESRKPAAQGKRGRKDKKAGQPVLVGAVQP